MADAYFAQQQHEHALTKYEEAFQVRGQVFQRVEKPMMELLFKLERTLSHLVASGYVEKFNETENRWKAFVLNPPPGILESRHDQSIIPGEDVAELQQLWKRVSRKQKSEVRFSNLINRLSMPSLLIPGIIIFILLIAVPLAFTFYKNAKDVVTEKQNAVGGTGKDSSEAADGSGGTNTAGGGGNGSGKSGSSSASASTASGNGTGSGSGSGSGANAGSGSSTGSGSGSGAAATKIASASVPSSSHAGTTSNTVAPSRTELNDWLDDIKGGKYSDREFATADNDLVLKFQTDKTVHLKNGNLPAMECTYYADGGDFANLFTLFEKTAFHKCYWLSLTRLGVIDAGGTNFFNTDGPEFNTIQQMARLAIQGKDLAGMRKIGGDNVYFKTPPGKTADGVINALKPELATKKPLSIVCIMMPDTKKKTVFVIGLDRNKNLLPAGRGGRNIVTAGDVDSTKQVLPEFENVILTDAPLQQSRYRTVYVLSILAVLFLLLCIFSKARVVKTIGVVLMIGMVIVALIALANGLQSVGLQKVK